MTDEGATDETAKRPAKRGMQVFRKADGAPLHETGMMSMPTTEPEATDKMMDWALRGGQDVKVLFGDPEAGGMSLVWSWFGPEFTLPRHSHSGDCLYFVHRGEVRMGNQVIGEGDGFFLPADAPYAYSAGPEGVEVLEFRGVSSFDMQITESLSRWDAIIEVSKANEQRWAADADANA